MNNIEKLENKHRIKELSPVETLDALGLKGDTTLLDFGAGTGVFSFPASHMTTGKIYAVDIDDQMINLLNERKDQGGVENLVPTLINSLDLPFDNESMDIIILVTVFHEVENKTKLIEEFHRLLKNKGQLGIIEFYKKKTPMGPSIQKRLSPEEVDDYFSLYFKKRNQVSLGENFYLSIYSKNKKD